MEETRAKLDEHTHSKQDLRQKSYRILPQTKGVDCRRQKGWGGKNRAGGLHLLLIFSIRSGMFVRNDTADEIY